MKRILTLPLLFLLLSATCAFAEVVINTNVEYYEVSGTSPKSILANLEMVSPLKRAKGKTYQGNTGSHIRYQYYTKQEDGRCFVDAPVVQVEVTYLYPRLIHAVNKDTERWWEELLDHLEIHEKIHGEICIKAARKLEEMLLGLSSDDCLNFKSIVTYRADRIFGEMRRDNRAYDELTEHGLHQDRNAGRYP